MSQLTCFVIIGFGKKMDYSSGRMLDMDKTYEYIIQPVFNELGFFCFRASDIKHSGVIDLPMYENILKADFVVADISTLNANVLYELGVRHAVKKNTTLVISENELTYPFDLSHITIDKYEHLGNAIDYGEVERFRKLLKEKVTSLLLQPAVDSPLYTFFPNLNIPSFSEIEIEEIKQNISDDGSLSDLMEEAEKAKNNKEYSRAISILEKAKALKQDNTLVTQRLALVTYKSEMPNRIESLNKALRILNELDPEHTSDLETLGLLGAINKRLYSELEGEEFLDQSIRFYGKGYYVGNDYYNGINLAFLYNLRAHKQEDDFDSVADFGYARRIRKEVLLLVEDLRADKNWDKRESYDKGWIYLTFAEAYFGLNELEKEAAILKEAEPNLLPFHIQSYNDQKKILNDNISEFRKRFPEL